MNEWKWEEKIEKRGGLNLSDNNYYAHTWGIFNLVGISTYDHYNVIIIIVYFFQRIYKKY